ncbi:hypothetical protein JCM14469_20890 [Desulfatiferula olefinivorans]
MPGWVSHNDTEFMTLMGTRCFAHPTARKPEGEGTVGGHDPLLQSLFDVRRELSAPPAPHVSP